MWKEDRMLQNYNEKNDWMIPFEIQFTEKVSVPLIQNKPEFETEQVDCKSVIAANLSLLK